MNSSNYAEYYHRTMQQHAKGVKPVVGGTGLGKTHGARLIVNDPQYADRKFIYMANRKQLLVEMAEKLDPTLYVMVPRDLEAVQDTLQRHRSALYHMLGDHTFRVFVESYSRYNGSWRIDLGATRQASKDLEEFLGRDPYVQKRLEDVMEGQVCRVLETFRAAPLAAMALPNVCDDAIAELISQRIREKSTSSAFNLLIGQRRCFEKLRVILWPLTSRKRRQGTRFIQNGRRVVSKMAAIHGAGLRSKRLCCRCRRAEELFEELGRSSR